jgi:hypothetical protein
LTNVVQAIEIAKRALPDSSVGLRALVVAIGGLESQWGDGFPGTNNWGAITAGSGWNGPTFEHEDSEWTPEGVRHYVTSFRAYDTPEAGAADLGRLLSSRYASAVRAAERGQWREVSRLLHEGGYYRGVKPPAQAIADHYERLREFLVAQGITPAVAGGALLLEWALWGALGWWFLKGKKHVRR